ncbi:MAG: metallophosphoesterase [Oligoflexia bacterium]|nr:metallophosphoesterase [Oligoflexia bacterium]
MRAALLLLLLLVLLMTGSYSYATTVTNHPSHSCTGGYRTIGDIHGNLQGMRKIIADLIDSKDNWNGDRDFCLISMGDVIDRGSESWESFELLQKLQEQAEKTKGKVIRLLGNHELLLLQDNFQLSKLNGACAWLKDKNATRSCNTDKLRPLFDKYKKIIANEVLAGKIRASYHIHLPTEDFILTHAGVSNSVCGQYSLSKLNKIDPAAFSAWLEKQLVQAVQQQKLHSNFFDNPQGIFWTRKKEEGGEMDKFCDAFSQIRGHTIQQRINKEKLVSQKGQQGQKEQKGKHVLYSVDTAIFENTPYSDEFLEISNKNVIAIKKLKN